MQKLLLPELTTAWEQSTYNLILMNIATALIAESLKGSCLIGCSTPACLHAQLLMMSLSLGPAELDFILRLFFYPVFVIKIYFK